MCHLVKGATKGEVVRIHTYVKNTGVMCVSVSGIYVVQGESGCGCGCVWPDKARLNRFFVLHVFLLDANDKLPGFATNKYFGEPYGYKKGGA